MAKNQGMCQKFKLGLGRQKNLGIKAPIAATGHYLVDAASTMIPSSSVVEQAAVNRLAGGSNPPWGANSGKSGSPTSGLFLCQNKIPPTKPPPKVFIVSRIAIV